jgi:hypothetical protein
MVARGVDVEASEFTAPGLAATAVSTTDRPSAPTAALAFKAILSVPVIENQAHVLAATFNSVLQWSAAFSRVKE